jgi:hypothetical protein
MLHRLVFWLAWHLGKKSRINNTERRDFLGQRYMYEGR